MMRTKSFALCALAVCASAVLIAARSRHADPLPAVLVLGDTVVRNSAITGDSTFVAKVGKTVGLRGIDGTRATATTDTVLKYYGSTWKDTAAYAILIEIGTRDIWRNTASGPDSLYSAYLVARNIQQLLDSIKKYQPNTRVILGTGYESAAWRGQTRDSVGVFAMRYQQGFVAIASAFDIPTVDIEAGFLRGTDYASGDVLFAQAGVNRAANNVGRVLRREMCRGNFYSYQGALTGKCW